MTSPIGNTRAATIAVGPGTGRGPTQDLDSEQTVGEVAVVESEAEISAGRGVAGRQNGIHVRGRLRVK